MRLIPSPNFWKGRKGYKPEAIVIHITDAPWTSVLNTFQNPKSSVSAHYLVRRDGFVFQFVKEEDTAWHAGKIQAPTWILLKPGVNPNLYTVGIELEGLDGDQPTLPQAIAAAWLINKICASWTIPLDSLHVITHRAINAGKVCPGAGIQVGCLVWLAQILGKS